EVSVAAAAVVSCLTSSVFSDTVVQPISAHTLNGISVFQRIFISGRITPSFCDRDGEGLSATPLRVTTCRQARSRQCPDNKNASKLAFDVMRTFGFHILVCASTT